MDFLKINREYLKELTEKQKRELLESINKEIQTVEAKKNQYNSFQLALKLVINGTYGAIANENFVVSNKHIANSITIHGRDVILYMLANIEDYFFNHWHLDKEIHDLLSEKYIAFDENNVAYMVNKNYQVILNEKFQEKGDDGNISQKASLNKLIKTWHISLDTLFEIENKIITCKFKDKSIDLIQKYVRKLHKFENVRQIDGTVTEEREHMDNHKTYFHNEDVIRYGDTDSIFSASIINTNTDNISIEDFYNRNIINGSNGETLKGHESVKTNELVLNYSKEKGLYFAPVKRIIRHKVIKDKWKIKTKSGKEIFITNDHSMVVFRDNKQIEIKPKDILKTDKILIINNA